MQLTNLWNNPVRAAFLTLLLTTAATTAQAEEVDGDFADGLSGGPDFWAVTGVGEGDALNMRAGPSTQHEVVMRFDNGAILRNHGCKMVDDTRWCQVSRPDAADDKGWVAGRYLRESGPPEGDATVAGTEFNATGQLPCTIAGETGASCDFGVVRHGGGTAAIHLELPNGSQRTLHFQSGEPLMLEGSDAEMTWRKEQDSTIVEAGGERYIVPDAVIFGG